MQSITASVIVPIYNSEKWLDRCITSILKQTYSQFEVLLINDGSTDKSESICKKYCSIDNRIKYFYKSNSGVSDTRNFGIENASGKYLFFVDSDDFLEAKYLSSLLSCFDDNSIDLSIGKFIVNNNAFKNDDFVLDKSKEIITKDSLLKLYITASKNCLYGFLWRCAFKRDIIISNNIRFEKIKMSEDYLFIMKYIKYINFAFLCKKYVYNYNVNNLSVTANYMSTLQYDMEYVNDYLEKNIVKKNMHLSFQGCKFNTYVQILQNICKNGTPYPNKKEKKDFVKSIRKKYIKEIYNFNLNFNLRKNLLFSKLFFMVRAEQFYIFLYCKRLKSKFGEQV